MEIISVDLELLRGGIIILKNIIGNKNQITKLYTLIQFLQTLSMSFFATNMILYMQKKGLSLFEIGMITIIIMVGVFLLEIPSGAYSDRFGRKKTYLISAFSFILGFTLYFVAWNNYFFPVASFFIAVGLSFKSGSLESWFVDRLKIMDSTLSLEKIYADISIFVQVASILGGLIGALVAYRMGLQYPWLLSIIVMLGVICIVIVFVNEDSKFDKKVKVSWSSGFQELKSSVIKGYKYSTGNVIIINIFLTSVFISFAVSTLVTYWQIFFSGFNKEQNSIIIMGYIWVMISLTRIVGGFLIKYLLKKNVNSLFIWISGNFFSGIVLVFIFFSTNLYFSLAFYLFYYLGQSVSSPIVSAKLNDNISVSERSTVLSYYSLVGQAGHIAGLLINGRVADYSLSLAWLISGIFIILSIIFVYRIKVFEDRQMNANLNSVVNEN